MDIYNDTPLSDIDGKAIKAVNTTLYSPANPATTTSTGVMAGLNMSFTVVRQGDVFLKIGGDYDNTVITAGVRLAIRYGTGTPPTNGTSLTGTLIGREIITTQPNHAGVLDPTTLLRASFNLFEPILNLDVGTYWFDLSVGTVTSGTARVRDISACAF